jgi:hypothetical protein
VDVRAGAAAEPGCPRPRTSHESWAARLAAS